MLRLEDLQISRILVRVNLELTQVCLIIHTLDTFLTSYHDISPSKISVHWVEYLLSEDKKVQTLHELSKMYTYVCMP